MNRELSPIENITYVDFYELINSKWDNMGKPEIYKDSYQIGKVSKNRNKSRLSNQKPIKLNGGGY